MSFAKETQGLVEQLIQAELDNASHLYGNFYKDKREAKEVLKEEVRESLAEVKKITNLMVNFIREPCISYVWCEDIEKAVVDAIKELSQVGAVVKKIKRKVYSLSNIDGNAFAIMGYVSKALKETSNDDIVQKYQAEAMSSDYEHLVKVSLDYLEVCNGRQRTS